MLIFKGVYDINCFLGYFMIFILSMNLIGSMSMSMQFMVMINNYFLFSMGGMVGIMILLGMINFGMIFGMGMYFGSMYVGMNLMNLMFFMNGMSFMGGMLMNGMGVFMILMRMESYN